MRSEAWRASGRGSRGVLCALGMMVAGAPLEGQAAYRSGFWASGGAGYVTLTAGCTTCEENTYRPGVAFYVRAGGTPVSAIRLGGELASLRRDGETSSVRLFLATVMAQWHPSVAAGFYLQAGYGVAYGRQDYTTDATTTRASRVGTGLVLGLGWDIPVGRIALIPFAAMYVAALGDIEVRDPSGAPFLLQDAIGTGYQLGLSVGSF